MAAEKKVTTVTLKDLAASLAETHGVAKSQMNGILAGMVDNGLGILQVRKRPARMGRNPATGETIKIKASKKIAFRASKDLKEMVM